MAQIENTIGVEGGAANGAVVWWALEGEVSIASLRAAWQAEGLDAAELPEAPSALVVLRRVLRGLLKADDAGLLLPIDGEVRGAGFQVLLRTKDSRGRTAYTVDWEVRLGPVVGDVPSLLFAKADGGDVSPDDVEWVQHDFSRAAGALVASDISSWLARQVRAHDAVPLRDNGGVYFIPETLMEGWRARMTALESVSMHRAWELPVLRSEKGVASLCAAFVAETLAEVARMNDALDGATMGKRALATRAQHAQGIEDKMARLEAVLGTSVEGVRDSLTTLRARIAEATIAVEAGE